MYPPALKLRHSQGMSEHVHGGHQQLIVSERVSTETPAPYRFSNHGLPFRRNSHMGIVDLIVASA
jgi:hypothetical protein